MALNDPLQWVVTSGFVILVLLVVFYIYRTMKKAEREAPVRDSKLKPAVMANKKSSNWDSLAIGIIAVFVGLVAVAFTGSVFNLFFVAIVVVVLWSDSNKLRDLQKRLSALEEKLSSITTSGSS